MLSIACKDFGIKCDYIAEAETQPELMKNVNAHAKSTHGYTDNQLNDPKIIEKANSLVKCVC